MSESDDHELELCSDLDGWDYAECSCGWASPRCPDQSIAAEFWADHREAVS